MDTAQIHGSGWLLLAAIIAAALLVGLVLLRFLSNNKAEVRITDAVIALIPILVALFATGNITRLVVGPEGFTVERAAQAIVSAATSAVKTQIDRIEPEPVATDEKAGIEQIPTYLARGVQALKFRIGGAYVASIIEQYLQRLTVNPQFRYVLFVDDDRLIGIIDARKLLAWGGEDWSRWNDLEAWIRDNPEALAQLPGFVGPDQAVPATATKREALQRLEDTDRDWLPVVDDRQQFAGVVDRARLTSSLILEVANQLEGNPNRQP
jgi:CBS domain-containing protein